MKHACACITLVVLAIGFAGVSGRSHVAIKPPPAGVVRPQPMNAPSSVPEPIPLWELLEDEETEYA